MNTVTVAIIGLGYWGPNLLRNFGATKDCTVKYGCDLQASNLEKFRPLYPSITFTSSTDDLLKDDDVDLVIIATPTSGHFSLAKAALEAGKHVFIEKPMTNTTAEAEELVALAKQKDRLIFVDHTFVFAPAVEKLSTLANAGDLGDLLYFDSTRFNLGLIQADTNVLWDLAIHDLSILSTIQDLGEAEYISAGGQSWFGKQIEHAHLHLTFKNFEARINVSWLSPVKMRHTILAGTKAMVTYDDTEPSEKIRIYDKGIEHDTTKADPFFPKYRSGDIRIPALPNTETLRAEAEHVVACVQGKEKPRVSGEDGLKMIRILEKSAEAFTRCSPVSLT